MCNAFSWRRRSRGNNITSNASAAAVDSIIIILFSSRTRSLSLSPVPNTRIRPRGVGGGDLSIYFSIILLFPGHHRPHWSSWCYKDTTHTSATPSLSYSQLQTYLHSFTLPPSPRSLWVIIRWNHPADNSAHSREAKYVYCCLEQVYIVHNNII